MKDYEIINHGPDHCQYWPGCGTAYTDFAHVVTGIGVDAVEAYNDAVEQVYQWVGSAADKLNLPERPRGLGITLRHRVPARSEDWYWYISIRFNV